MRIWFKMMKDNHLLRDTTITDESDDTRTHKIFRAIDEVCYAFDLGKPIWLDVNVAEFKRHAKTRFTQDSFIESIDFDFLEMHVICILHVSTDYLLMGSEPSKEEVKNDLLSIISELSTIAKKI